MDKFPIVRYLCLHSAGQQRKCVAGRKRQEQRSHVFSRAGYRRAVRNFGDPAAALVGRQRLALPFAGLAILVHDVGSRHGAASSILFAIFCALRGP